MLSACIICHKKKVYCYFPAKFPVMSDSVSRSNATSPAAIHAPIAPGSVQNACKISISGLFLIEYHSLTRVVYTRESGRDTQTVSPPGIAQSQFPKASNNMHTHRLHTPSPSPLSNQRITIQSLRPTADETGIWEDTSPSTKPSSRRARRI